MWLSLDIWFYMLSSGDRVVVEYWYSLKIIRYMFSWSVTLLTYSWCGNNWKSMLHRTGVNISEINRINLQTFNSSQIQTTMTGKMQSISPTRWIHQVADKLIGAALGRAMISVRFVGVDLCSAARRPLGWRPWFLVLQLSTRILTY